jgi:hypothetical protein
MRRLGKVVAILVIVSLMQAMPAAARGDDRAVWIWNEPGTLDVDTIAAEGFNQIYLWAPTGFSGDPAFSAFVDRAHSIGLDVFAVGGDPAWAADPGAWRTWAREVERSGAWDGAVLDVEPYLHPDWNTNRHDLLRSYFRGMRAADRQLSIPMHVAVPFWFDEIPYKRSTALAKVLKQADGIVVLAYRDHAEGVDGILQLSSEEIAAAQARGRSVVIGVETGHVSLDKVTFAEEGRSVLDAELAIVRSALASSSSFTGTSVHYWAAFSTLPE